MSLVHYSPQWLLHIIKDKWPAAANPNMKKNLCESLKKWAMAAVVLLGLLLMYNNNSKPALPPPRQAGRCKQYRCAVFDK